MMKRILPYIIMLLLVVVIVLIGFPDKFKTSKESTFAVSSGSEIAKIVLSEMGGESVVLKRDGDNWTVNDKYAVRNRQINTLVKTLKKIRSVHPVSNAGHNNILREIMSSGVKAEIFDGKNKEMKVLYVGGATVKQDGTYMLMEENGKLGERPYVVNIPGFNGSLRSRFITSEQNWRSREVLSIKAENIKKVSIEYPTNPEASFSIAQNNGDLKLLPDNYRQPNTQLLKAYLDLFKSKSVETYINTYSKKDSILKTQPFCNLLIESNDGKTEEFSFFYKEVSERSKAQTDDRGMEMTFDVDRYYALVNQKQDFAIIQYYVFGGVFQKYEDFFDTPDVSS